MSSVLLDSRVSGIILITCVVNIQGLTLKNCLLPTSSLYINLFLKISEATVLSGIILQEKITIDHSGQICFSPLTYPF